MLKQRYPHGQWSFKSVEDIPSLTNKSLQLIVRELTTAEIVNVLYPCQKQIQQRVLNNISRVISDMLIEQMAKVEPNLEDIRAAQEKFVSFANETLKKQELKIWKEWMVRLPDDPLPEKPDEDLILSLIDEQTVKWIDSITWVDLNRLIWIDSWQSVLEKKVQPYVWKDRFAKERLSAESRPQFQWEVEITQCYFTAIAKRLCHDT